MQFSDTSSTKSGIIQLIEQEGKLGDTAISGSAPLLAEWTNRINIWVHIAGHWIHQAQGKAKYLDKNNTTPALISIVDNQAAYTLATNGENDSRVVNGVELRDTTTQEYFWLDYLTDRTEIEDIGNETKGTPTHYYVEGNILNLYPRADITKVDKIRVSEDQNAALFTSADTTKTPGFDIRFHPILVYGPLLTWALPLGRAETVTLCRSMLFGTDPVVDIGLKRMMEEHYSRRVAENTPKIGRKTKNFL